MKNITTILLALFIFTSVSAQKIKVKKTEIKVNDTSIGKALPIKKGEKYDFQDMNGNHLFFGDYYSKQIKGTEDKVNYIEIKINENDEPVSFNAETELTEISLASFSFDNSREIVFQLFKKGFVTEESGFDMAKITEFANSKANADLTKSSTMERNPTDIGTNSKSDGTGLSTGFIDNIISESATFTIENVQYNGLVTIIFSPLTMGDEEKLSNAEPALVNYVKGIKEENFGRRAIVNYQETLEDGTKQERLLTVKSKSGFSISVNKEDGKTYKFYSYEFEDNNLIGEGIGLLKMATKNVDDSKLNIKSQEPVVYFNVVSEFDGIMILQDPVSNTLSVKIPSNKKVMAINDMFLGSYLPKNLKKYLNCKGLNDEIDELKSISDLENLLKGYQEECK